MLAQHNEKKTAWSMAVQEGKAKGLHKLWEWAKGLLNRDELNNILLLAKDDKEMTALHHATFNGNVQILERIWKWAIEQLTTKS